MSDHAQAQGQTAQKTYKRKIRNIVIHKPMQREFSLVLISLLIISTLAVGYVIHRTIHEAAFGGGFRFGKISPYEVLSDVSYDLLVRVTFILFLAMIVIGIFGVFFLHRVAGPVYHFRQVLTRLNEGESPPPVKLREGDFFHETAEEINRVVTQIKFERNRSKLMKERLDQMLTAPGLTEAVARAIKELRGMLDRKPEED